MPISILQTKLYIPHPRPNLVPRARLIAALEAGRHRKLSLISASAGFGKTTLVSVWLGAAPAAADAQQGRVGQNDQSATPAASVDQRVAWLALDEGDNDPLRFLAYVVAALQTIAPDWGHGVSALIQSPQPPPSETILTALLNDIAALPGKVILVLDDYHVLDSSAIDQALAFLLEHLPRQMHLVITTREDPNVPLSKLRARDQVTEIRATDLRFTPDEAAHFLNQVMGLTLSAVDIAALESRTEGWIAGLQLAALSLQKRTHVSDFIQAFAGDNHYIVDYLVEEVLQRQPEQIRRFLHQTSILSHLSGPLCDAVADQSASGELLEALERANLFVIPLDDKRQWYRYHHLFADVLHARAMKEYPDQMPVWHGRASLWFEAHGQPADAIDHALAAMDFARAANLVELMWPAMHRSGFHSPELRGWLDALPDECICTRPVLSVGSAWEHLNRGELEDAERCLQVAERWLAGGPQTTAGDKPDAPAREMVVMDAEEFRALPAEIASARTYLALAHGDLVGTVTHARQTLDLIPADEYVRRGPAASLLGLAYWTSGDLDAAYTALAHGMAGFQKAGNISFAISGTYGLADIRITQGRLREAVRIYEQALQLAQTQGEPPIQGTAELFLGLGELAHEQGHEELAAQHLQTSQALGERAGLPNWPLRWCMIQAAIHASQGHLDDAHQLLDKAALLYIRSPVPDIRPIAASKARVWAKQGRLTNALAWAHEQGLTTDDPLSYLREYEHITLARVLIAQSRQAGIDAPLEQATALLARLLQAADAGARVGSAIEILLLQALAHEAAGETSAARTPLLRALTLAEPEGYVRIFADEGPPMATLLRDVVTHTKTQEHAQQNDVVRYAARLLTVIAPEDRVQPTAPVAQPASGSHGAFDAALSDRELDVLKLLRTELTGPEIARELVISLNTMRTHSKNIYSKLAVTNRRAAVRRGEELGLL